MIQKFDFLVIGGGIAGRAGAKNEKADVSGFHGDGGRWFHAPECKKDVQK